MFDVLIKGGLVVKGDGSEPVKCDIGIENEQITAMGIGLSVGAVRRVIEADGLVVTPGFVDMHTHADLYPLRDNKMPVLLFQGVTTTLAGHCGISTAPCSRNNQPLWRDMNASVWGAYSPGWEWESMGEFLNHLHTTPFTANFGMLAGLGSIRLDLIGPSADPVSPEKIYEACLKTLDEGAFGISLGPYFPCVYSRTEDFEAAARAVAEKDGVLSIHMRNYGDELEESFSEYLEIARKTGCSLQISHLYAAGKRNWHRLRKVIKEIEEARAHGVNVNYDRHVYAAGSASIIALLPPWAQEGGHAAIRERLRSPKVREQIKKDLETGLPQWDCLVNLAGWENIKAIISSQGPEKEQFSNKDLLQISQQEGLDPVDALCELIANHGEKTAMIIHHMEEQGIVDCLTHPLGMVGSDSSYCNQPHPRTYGNFPRWFGHYIRDQKILSLGEAVYKCTGLPCQKFGIHKRGVLEPGNYGDITIIDWEKYEELGTFAQPEQYPRGIKHVLVNGKLVVEDGKLTGILSGKVLRREYGK